MALVVTDWLAEARETGALADLAGLLREAANLGYPDAWTESLLRHQRFGDAVLGLPFHDGPECLVYRTDLLAEAGLAPPQTWDEFRRAARKLSEPGARRWGAVLAGFPDGHNPVYDFCVQLWSRGGEVFDGAGRARLTGPEAAAALEFLRELVRDRKAMHPDSPRLDSVAAGEAFARGEAAMTINWFGFAVLAQTAADSRVRGRVSVAPIPMGAPGGAGVTLNVYWVIAAAAGSPHPETAFGFMRHCAGPDGDRRLTLAGAVGCRRSTWRNPEVIRAIPFYPRLEQLHAGARELPRLKEWDRVAAIVDRLVTRAIGGDEPAARLLAEAQAEADALQK